MVQENRGLYFLQRESKFLVADVFNKTAFIFEYMGRNFVINTFSMLGDGSLYVKMENFFDSDFYAVMKERLTISDDELNMVLLNKEMFLTNLFNPQRLMESVYITDERHHIVELAEELLYLAEEKHAECKVYH